jgi:hypothetical protein
MVEIGLRSSAYCGFALGPIKDGFHLASAVRLDPMTVRADASSCVDGMSFDKVDVQERQQIAA